MGERDAFPPGELAQLRSSVSRLGERLSLLEKQHRRVRLDVDAMITSDQIAKGVADELERRRRQDGQHVSSVWMKIGIAAVCLSIPISVVGIVAQIVS